MTGTVGELFIPAWGHINYTDPDLSCEHFKFVTRQRVRAYMSKCLQERPRSLTNYTNPGLSRVHFKFCGLGEGLGLGVGEG